MRKPGTAYSLGASGSRRRRPFSRSLYCYLLLQQAWPFALLLMGGAALFLYWGGLDSAAFRGLSGAYEVGGQARGRADARRVHQGGQAVRFEEKIPVFGFVLFGSYRTGSSAIAAVGLSGLVFHDKLKLGACTWREREGGHRVKGTIEAFYPGEHHDLKYEALVLQCLLEESTEHDAGGDLYMEVDAEELLVYREESGAFPRAEPLPPYKRNITFCSPPLTGHLRPKQVYEWIEYHLRQGVDYMVFYDAGGVNMEVMGVLQPYLQLGLGEVVDTRKVLKYDAWEHGNVLVVNDCVYRTRFSSRWAIFWDMSEYFDAEGGELLAEVLQAHATAPDPPPYLSLGSRWWSIERCNPELHKSDWAVERMVYHWPDIYCVNKEEFPKPDLCLDYYGFRRLVVDPRSVTTLQIHRAEEPKSGGVDLSTDVARLNRFSKVLEKGAKACSTIVEATETLDWWVRDSSIAAIATKTKIEPKVRYRPRLGTFPETGGGDLSA